MAEGQRLTYGLTATSMSGLPASGACAQAPHERQPAACLHTADPQDRMLQRALLTPTLAAVT
jgi:hypothetical protein